MTTALSIIDRAFELIGYKDPDETLSGAESQVGLAVLNSMLDGWNTQRLFIVTTQDVSQSVSGLPITIGVGGTINVTRPVRMEQGAFVRQSNADYPITWLTSGEYQSIILKSTTSNLPCYGYYEPAVPLGKIYLWPSPSAAVELHLQVMTQLVEFADLATDYNLAPGYRKALQFSLAEELAPGRRPLEARIERSAANARRAIRRTNVEVPQMGFLSPGMSPLAAFTTGL